MSLVFKTIQTEGIAELSYLVGDDDEGVAAVFDPRADCDVYIEAARDAGVIITHIFWNRNREPEPGSNLNI